MRWGSCCVKSAGFSLARVQRHLCLGNNSSGPTIWKADGSLPNRRFATSMQRNTGQCYLVTDPDWSDEIGFAFYRCGSGTLVEIEGRSDASNRIRRSHNRAAVHHAVPIGHFWLNHQFRYDLLLGNGD